MRTVLLTLLQAAAAPPEGEPPAAIPRAAIVAEPLRVRRPCEASPDPDDVVVCGRSHDDRFRLRPIPLPPGMKPPVDGPGTDFDIGPAHGNVYAETVARPDGIPDRRIMVSLKLPF